MSQSRFAFSASQCFSALLDETEITVCVYGRRVLVIHRKGRLQGVLVVTWTPVVLPGLEGHHVLMVGVEEAEYPLATVGDGVAVFSNLLAIVSPADYHV